MPIFESGKQKAMKNKDYRQFGKRENRPGVSIGIFFIVLGIALLIATNDVFHLGSMSSYFNWKTVMIFIGVILLLNLEFVGGILMTAAGIWFLQDDLFPFAHEAFNTFFWPSVIALIGLSFILSSFFKKNSLKQ
jgi:chromate transport protein ChrA